MRVEVAGEANSTGFEIYDRRGRQSQTDNYRDGVLNNSLVALALILFYSLFCGILFFILFLTSKGKFALYGFLAALLGLIISFIISQRNSACQWHACEHKVIRLLESELDINLENLKKMSRISPNCGCSSRFIQFFTTARPTGNQLQETIRVAKDFENKLNQKQYFIRMPLFR